MERQDTSIPWWQRELNAHLARRARRLQARRRLAARALGGAALVALGLLVVLLLAQNTQREFAQGVRHRHGPTPVTPSSATLATTHLTGRAFGAAPQNTPAGSTRGATFTLDPPVAWGNGGRSGSTLRVTLTDRTGAPLVGYTVWLTITGQLPFTGVSTTNARGAADFPYRGVAPYTVHLAATLAGKERVERTVQVRPEVAVATTEVTGRFYASDDRCTYDTQPGTAPLFSEHFPTINFAGRPFTDASVQEGQPNTVAARGAMQVGRGRLNHFTAAFTGSFVVRTAGDHSFTFLIDDAFNLGVGGAASRVNGSMSNPPARGRTAILQLPVLGAFNQGHLAATTQVTVHFPRAGTYPYEVDYAECSGGGAALRISTGGQFLPSVAQG